MRNGPRHVENDHPGDHEQETSDAPGRHRLSVGEYSDRRDAPRPEHPGAVPADGADETDAGTVPVLRAMVGHALAFGTWCSLVRDRGLGDDEVVDLMLALVRCAASTLPT